MAVSGKARKGLSECAEFKKLISAYIDGETGSEENESVSSHISKCPGCKRELANMYAMREMIQNVYAPKEKVDFAGNIMARLNAVKKRRQKSSGNAAVSLRVTVLRYAAVAAAVFIALSATVLYSQNQTKKMLAEKRKFDTYVVEHSIQTAGDMDSASQVIAVNFEK